MPVGRIVLDEDVTEVVDDTKEKFDIKIPGMSQAVKKICEIAVELRDDFQVSVENLLNIIQEHCPKYINSPSILQVLIVYKKYSSKKLE